MAKAPQGLLGPFIGKIGNVVGYILNGNYVVRSLPRKRKGPKTLKEKSNTAKFKCVQTWMKPLRDFVRVGYKDYGTATGGYKGAVSYALNHAVMGAYPDHYVEPELMKVSGGELCSPEFSEAALEEGTMLRFTWETNSGSNGNPYDQAMLLAYCITHKSVVSKVTGAFRMDGTDTLQLFQDKMDKEYHVYLGFVAQDRSCQGGSKYLGKVLVPKK